MIDLTKAVLPTSIKVGGEYYRIHTDYRYILEFLEVYNNNIRAERNDKWLSLFDFVFIDKIPYAKRAQAVLAVLDFALDESELPRSDGNSKEVLDFKIDGNLIYCAFMQCYKIDLLTTDLHWYQFNALLEGINGTLLNEVIDIRLWRNTEKRPSEYSRAMEKRQKAWALPPKTYTRENDKALDDYLKLFE